MQTLVLAKKVCDENRKNKTKIKMTGASDKLIREKRVQRRIIEQRQKQHFIIEDIDSL